MKHTILKIRIYGTWRASRLGILNALLLRLIEIIFFHKGISGMKEETRHKDRPISNNKDDKIINVLILTRVQVGRKGRR